MRVVNSVIEGIEEFSEVWEEQAPGYEAGRVVMIVASVKRVQPHTGNSLPIDNPALPRINATV